jgi:hypothetical protein
MKAGQNNKISRVGDEEFDSYQRGRVGLNQPVGLLLKLNLVVQEDSSRLKRGFRGVRLNVSQGKNPYKK